MNQSSYRRQLNAAKKMVERDVYREYFVNTRTREASAMISEKRVFLSHPQRLISDTDVGFSEYPRKLATRSTTSTPIQDYDCGDYNKLEEQNLSRPRKQHSILTHTKRVNYECIPDVNIGDNGKSKLIVQRKTETHLSNVNFYSSNQNINQLKKNILTDSMFEKKFELFVEKSLHTISDIRSLIEKGIDPPDGDEDISRRLLRVKEFSNRFSRNYLYPINRHLEDLNKIKIASFANPNQKFLSAYQIVLNGLQAYLSHLPTSIGGCSSDKLKILLKQLIELLDIHNNMFKESEDGHYSDLVVNFRLNTELTLQKIENHFTTMSSENMSKSNITKTSLTQKKTKGSKTKNNMTDRLSMYNKTLACRRDALWKKTADSLTKKNNVKSRYKTSLFKHRTPIEPKVPILQLPNKCKLLSNKSSAILKKTPYISPINEDKIITMIGMDSKSSDNNANENQKEELNQEELIFKLLKLVLDNNIKNENSSTTNNNEEKIADILNKLQDTVDADMLQKIADGLRKHKHVDNESLVKLNFLKTVESIESTVSRKKEPIVTVTGVRNAKLICIKDDNSVIESDGDIIPQQNNNQAEKNIDIKHTTSNTQTENGKYQKKTKGTQKPSTSLKRLPKPYKNLEGLPKDYAVNVIQYKLDFHKYCKNNNMYRKTTSIVPWKLMGKLSDEVIDMALLNISKEIKINELAERLFRSELQL